MITFQRLREATLIAVKRYVETGELVKESPEEITCIVKKVATKA
jgi:hypothetical protein